MVVVVRRVFQLWSVRACFPPLLLDIPAFGLKGVLLLKVWTLVDMYLQKCLFHSHDLARCKSVYEGGLILNEDRFLARAGCLRAFSVVVGPLSQPALVLSMIGQEICADSDCYVRVGR
jgi:hypothetical protein